METRAWHVLLVTELDDNATDIREQIGQGAIAGKAVFWQVVSWSELKVQSPHYDAVIIIEPPDDRPGLSWLRQRAPESPPPVLYVLPSEDEAAAAAGEQAGACVLALTSLLHAGSVLRSALAQTLRLGQARHLLHEQQRILECVHDAVIVINAAGRITGWTGAAEKLYGWSASEALGKQATKLLDSPLSPELRATILQEIGIIGSFETEISQSNRAGERVYVEVAGIPLYEPDGSLHGLVVANRDVTARKAAQEALQKSNHELEAALSSIAEAHLSFDSDWRLAAVNPAAIDALFAGQPVEHLSGRVMWDEFPQAVRGLFYDKFYDAVNTGLAVHFEAPFSPQKRWYEVHAFPHERRLDVYMRDISQRKQAENEREQLMITLGHERIRLVYLVEGLRASEELYRATFDNASVGISHVSLNGEWLKVNDRLCQITGYSREELLKTTFQSVTYHQDLQIDLDLMSRMLRSEIPGYQIEKRYIHKNGNIIWIHLSTALQRDEYDQPAYIISVIQDISDRKRLEAHDRFLIDLGDRLARAETQSEMVSLTVESVGQYFRVDRCLVAEVDKRHNQTEVHLDYHPGLGSMCGLYPTSVHPPAILTDLMQCLQVVVQDTARDVRTRDYFERTYCPYGTRAYVHTPFVRDEQWVGMLSVLSNSVRAWEEIDLSLLRSATELLWLNLEKVRLLDNLRKSEERLRLALSSSGVTVFGQDENLRSTWVYNPDSAVDADGLLGLSEGHLLTPEDAVHLENLKREVLATGQQGRQEVQIEIDQQVHYYQLVIEPARDASGKINGILASGMDITERRQSEEAIKQYAQRLERSNRDLEDFAFIASHDLQEPLRKVRAFGHMLEEDYRAQLDKVALSYLQRMLNASQRMQNMIDDLLAYARVSTKGKTFAPVNLGVIAAEVLTDLEVLIQQTGGQVELGELPEIDADRLQMQLLLQNLIGNALKFHLPEQPPHVRISARYAAPRQVELVIGDNGIGFSEEYIELIFQPFYRLHGRSEFEGSGIGLAICRKIAERHGGSITAHSQPGQGSQFIVTLPVKH